MAELIPFIPKATLTAAANMEAFVRMCRHDLDVYGSDLDFDAPTWDVTKFYFKRGFKGRMLLNFVEEARKQKTLPGSPVKEPFASQVKAYIRYYVGIKAPTSPPLMEIRAMRELYWAFLKSGLKPDLGAINAQLLDQAVDLADTRVPGDYGPRVGLHLRYLSTFLHEKHLAANAPVDWKHGLKWQVAKKRRLGEAAKAIREKKLPSDRALRALPTAFQLAKSPQDIISTSVMALLSCAPSRVNEIFALAADCEVQPLSEGEQGYMLRWAGSKGYPDFIKGIPAVMADVAKEAICRLRDQTDEARRIAGWYERYPDQLYLPEDCAGLRGKILTGADIEQIIGFTRPKEGQLWAQRQGIRATALVRGANGRTSRGFKFADIETAILSLLPRGFPLMDKATGLRYSEALMIVRRREFGSRRQARWRCMFDAVSYDNIMKQFHTADGIFARLGLSNPDDPITLKTHQLRHYLNTLAQRGGLSEAEIAAWSGRADVRQNTVYDHRTPEERLEQGRRREKELANVRGQRIRVNPPVSREDGQKRATHGHATEIGFCEHDFASSPCSMFMECLHCTKHVCVKGHDPQHTKRVSLALESARRSLAEAEAAMAKEYFGAEEWVRAHRGTIDRLEQLLAILLNPSVPDGTLIRLSRSGQYSLIEQAMRDHEAVTGAVLLHNHRSEAPDGLPGSDA
ncbi:hypothetical protein BB934_26475 [Microvirga ossetica]|uniref:Integrase n=1 Tax=Microvirga ossetica TaxID=1882682 RepID=A0A1B2EMY7_9HYPH|nr:hypothetical protein [Microvirga ossetica]ANY81330.1 hypothetical protein BB934_26475 [Microvirga ossetica]